MTSPHTIEMRPARIAGQHLFAANDPHKSHRVSRESTGCGLDESTTVVCTCGWRGQPRFGWQDRQSALLRDDELAHRH